MTETHWLQQIKYISLDWGDTLIHIAGRDFKLYDFRRLEEFQGHLSKSDPKLSQEWDSKEIVEKLYFEYAKNYNHEGVDWLDCNKSDLLKEILKAKFSTRLKPYYEKLFQLFCQVDERVHPFYAGLPRLFNFFKSQNWSIGILSHVNLEEHYVQDCFDKANLLNKINFFSLSGDLKRTKPHHAHFDDFIKKAGVEPSQILHVGDHPQKDILGAKKAGFRAALIVEPGIYPPKDIANSNADLYINNIFELEYIIEEYHKGADLKIYQSPYQ